MGYVFSAMSIGMLLGPLLGGIVFDKGGYNEVYAMAYILIGVDIALRLLMIEKKVAKKWETHETDNNVGFALGESSETRKAIQGSDRSTVSQREASQQLKSEVEIAGVAQDQRLITSAGSPSTIRPAVQRSRYPPMITLLKSRRLLCALWGVMVRIRIVLETRLQRMLTRYRR
jgi:MFS family permease